MTFVGLLVAVIGLLTWQVFLGREPSYHGRSLSGWLDRAYHNDDWRLVELYNSELNLQSADAVRAMGTDTLPTLLEMVRVRNSPFRQRSIELVQNESWFPLHVQSTKEIHEKAAFAFKVLGPSAKSVVSALNALLDDKDPEVRVMAMYCLGTIGPASVKAVGSLQRILNRTMPTGPSAAWDMEQKYFAAFALGEIGPEAHSALPQLKALSSDSNGLVRISAKAAIIKVSGSGLDELIETLTDTSSPTNWLLACEVVGRLGSKGSNAVPSLIKATEQSDWHVQDKAIEALGKIHTWPELCIPAISPFLRSTNNLVRSHSLLSISAFGISAKSLVPASEILRCLNDPDGEVQRSATNALRFLAPEAAAKAGVPMKP